MKKKQHSLLLGAHMSIAQGFANSVEQGESIGCTAIQFFTKSNRQWAARAISDAEIDLYLSALKQSSIKSVVAHATYLINLGSPDNATAKKSTIALKNELDRCDLLEVPYLVLHPGSRLESDEKESLQRVADNLNQAMAQTTSKTMVLLETMAGQGSTLGNTFEQLAFIRSQSEFKTRVGVCLDTCHVFAAGHDISTKAGYTKMWQSFEDVIGLSHLKAIHLNDSKKEVGSRVDRHTDIGKGHIGLEGFSLLINDERFFDIPKILETPKKDGLSEDLVNLNTIKSLLSHNTRKTLGLEKD